MEGWPGGGCQACCAAKDKGIVIANAPDRNPVLIIKRSRSLNPGAMIAVQPPNRKFPITS
jgi:hypothetical protein